jgi:hypothetical protein
VLRAVAGTQRQDGRGRALPQGDAGRLDRRAHKAQAAEVFGQRASGTALTKANIASQERRVRMLFIRIPSAGGD